MDLGLLQADAAKQMQICSDTITNWENNYSVPQINLYPAIISFLGYNPIVVDETTLRGKLFAYRCTHGLSYKALGKLLGVDGSTVRAWERGLRPTPYKMLMLLKKH